MTHFHVVAVDSADVISRSAAMAASVGTVAEGPIKGVPMIPNPSWIMGHLSILFEREFRARMYRFSVEYADSKGRCTFWMGPTVVGLSVTSPDDVQLLLKSSSHRTLLSFIARHLYRVFGDRNIGTLSGKMWKTQRASVSRALHSAVQRDHLKRAIVSSSQILLNRLLIEAEFGNTEYELLHLMKILTMDTFGQAALNVELQCCEKLQLSRIATAMEFLVSSMMKRMTSGMFNPASQLYFWPTEENRRHHEERSYLQSVINDLVHKRRQLLHDKKEEAPEDLLAELIRVAEDSEDALSDQTLTDTIASLFLAGYETTSVTLTYLIYMLSQHPDVETLVLEELAAASSCHHYVEAVIKETMRLHPPATITNRTLEKTVKLDKNVTAPKGTYLYFPIWVIQRNPKTFPRPEEFLPERWVCRDDNGEWVPRTSDMAVDSGIPCGDPRGFVAFSAGARSCPGQRFAMEEMIASLQVLLPRLQFTPADGYVLEPERPGIIQLPKEGLPVRITARKR